MIDLINDIPESKRDEVKANILAYMPNNQTIDDPDWITANPDWETEGLTPDQIPEYTNMEWLDECIFQWLKRCNRKGKLKISNASVAGEDDIRVE